MTLTASQIKYQNNNREYYTFNLLNDHPTSIPETLMINDTLYTLLNMKEGTLYFYERYEKR